MGEGIMGALITGICTIIAAIIGIYHKNHKDKKVTTKPEEYIDIPVQEHPTLLNPDEYDIEDEEYFITLGGLLQQSRNPKDVTVKKLNKDNKGKSI